MGWSRCWWLYPCTRRRGKWHKLFGMRVGCVLKMLSRGFARRPQPICPHPYWCPKLRQRCSHPPRFQGSPSIIINIKSWLSVKVVHFFDLCDWFLKGYGYDKILSILVMEAMVSKIKLLLYQLIDHR